jgi:hypothetical protein
MNNELNRVAIKNYLRAHSKFYNQNIKDDMLEAFSYKLGEVDANILLKALDQIASTADKSFPTLQDIKNACANFGYMIKGLDNSELEKENKQYDEVKKFIDSQISRDDLQKFINYYMVKLFDSKEYVAELKRFGLTFSIFEKCAYFDLYQAKLNVTKAIEITEQYVGEIGKQRKINYWH